ncbi:MAG: septation protein SpoVG family protein [Ignavibacteriaceae bacterium]
MKIVRMNALHNSSSKTLAFFDVQTQDGIIIKGFRVVDGTKGLFISSPDERGKDGKFYENVILPREMKENLQEMALSEYGRQN